MASSTILTVCAAYLLILLFLGLWGSRDSQSVESYFVAGKQLPSWVIAFSSNATGESGWLLLGLTGMGYLVGVHALWVVLGEVLGVALGWALVAKPFKEFTDRYHSITVPDYLVDRFRDRRGWLRYLSVAIILSMVVAYLSAQLVAAGKAFVAFLDLSYTHGVLLGAAITLFYTAVGGFKAVSYTDLLQGLLMLLGLIVLPIVGIASAGGWMTLTARLHEIDPNLLLPMGKAGLSAPGIASAVGFVAIGIAFLGVPQLLVRFISAKSSREIVRGGLIAVLCIIFFDVGAVLAGMAGRVLFPNLSDPETIMPTMSRELFPAVMTGVLVVVVLGAIMSTVDSLLILASSAVVRDIIQKVYHPRISELALSRMGKVVTVIIGGCALGFAVAQIRMIFWFVLFAWSGLAAAFVPVVVCSLFWKRTTLAGALTGMAGGFLTTVIWVLQFKERFYDLYEMLPGSLVGALLVVIVSLFTKPPQGVDEDFEAVRAAVTARALNR